MQSIRLGHSDLEVSRICLGTMTFGEQVNETDAHAILDRSLARGIDFIDTAEMYSVPPRAETCGATETILGTWFARNPGVRNKVVLASKVAGPSRAMPWIRANSGLDATDIIRSCEASLRRLQTDVIDLYQLHWPARNVPMFGGLYYDPAHDHPALSIHEQLEAFDRLVRDGKVRYIGLSNETPYGVHEFVRLAEQHGLPRIVSVQNPYCLVARGYDNGLDETCHHLGVSLLAYSPLAFGLLTGKYDLVISDVMMPEMDGITMLKNIKSNSNISDVPVILLTSKSEVENRLEGLRKGADAFLAKPFNMEELHILIDNLVDNVRRIRGKYSGAQGQKAKIEQIQVKGNNDALMERVMNYMNEHLADQDLNVEKLTADVGISRAQLHRKLKEIAGVSAGEFIRNLRLEQAARLIEEGQINITQVAYSVGFNNQTHFSTVFKKHYGMSPSEYAETKRNEK